MHIFRRNISQINVVNLCTVFHIECHSWLCCHISDGKLRVFLQFVRKTGASLKHSFRQLLRSLLIDLFHTLYDFKSLARPGIPYALKKVKPPGRSSSPSALLPPRQDWSSVDQDLFPGTPQRHRTTLNQLRYKYDFHFRSRTHLPLFMPLHSH